MALPRRLTATHVSQVALAAWCCSLPLTGFSLYAGQRHLTGFEILATGWLSPLALNFAWFANIFFLYGIFRLLTGNAPNKSAVLAPLLSLDTVRFSQFTLNEGGATTPIYGYGWGAVLWIGSIFVMLLAAGIRHREKSDLLSPGDTHEWWFQPLGLIFTVAAIGGASYFSIHDRMVANPSETQRLGSAIAFKRGTVCAAPEPAVVQPIRGLAGPVEVVFEKRVWNASYPFAQVKDLLKWGIPVVRLGRDDFSYEPTAQGGQLTSVPASGAPAATLFVTESYLGFINAQLVETATKRVVFDQTWRREDHPVNTNYYCPDYHSFPQEHEQPRKLLIQALGLQELGAKSTKQFTEPKVFDRVAGTIIEQKSGGETFSMKMERWKKVNPDPRIGLPFHEIFSINCPSEIGWKKQDEKSSLNTGWSFWVNGKTYFPRSGTYYSTCEGDFAYIYSGVAQNGKYYLNVEKRVLQGFRQAWAGIVVIDTANQAMRDDVLKVQSVKDLTDAVVIELVNDASGQILFVQAPLHEQ